MKDFKKIKLIILDNDGVLTDGRIIYNDNQVEAKNFSAKDGLGIRLLQQTDIKLAIITGRTSRILEKRCDDLDLKMVFQRVRNKLKKTEELLKELKINWENVAYLGDDWNDYPVMKRCAVSACPVDAFPQIKDKVDIVLSRKGGKGAVREFIELIMQEQEIYEKAVQKLLDLLENS
ncbi:MAG: HAD-IIIA family hydrolase [Candidatus Cloacimonetes bacterium]|nr:HAD-IIIA family hydrolase [Candidatus Cloacimonadota bacterium]MCF7815125.1 HAD-IIIA family hydrolase [Candidatus Cloacimonadota bacterium]MCF7869358.1 HAD-IIIA family hydrolase [Candidatus Cloacimonadota bacterium]MCF7884753.1 HAD-IIIA family hydrolase [Candidatus Cloacimonadota bacterium]